MKKIAIILVTVLVCATCTMAQKYAFVDSDYILSKIPEYETAQKTIEGISVGWQKQIEANYGEIDRLYKAYQAEQVLLTEEMKAKRENEIIRKEKEAKDYQKSKFGVKGELFKKRQELIQPIQDKIYNAVKEMAERSSYAMILDKKSANMLYTNPRFDKSDDILKKLGISPGKK